MIVNEGGVVNGVLIAQFVVTGVSLGSIYALIGLGYNLIFNATDVINFAQGEFVMLGGFLSVVFATQLGLPVVIAVPIAILVVGALGGLVYFAAIARVRRGSVMTMVIITLGVSLVIKTVALLIAGPNPLYLRHFISVESVRIHGVVIQTQSLLVISVSVLLMMVLTIFFHRTGFGQDMLACAMNREASQLVGINIKAVILLSFFLSAAIGAVGGALITPIQNVTYDEGLVLALNGFAALALGGLGSSFGAILGGMILGLLQSLSLVVVPSGWTNSTGLIVLVLVLVIRPSGILGGRQERRHTETI